MNERNRKRWLLLVAGACVLLLTADRFVLSPMAAAWKRRSVRIEELKSSIEKGRILLDRQDSLEERWDTVQKNALPVSPPAAENQVLTSVNSWAAASGLNVTALLPRWIEDKDLGPRMEIRVSGTGSLEAVTRFLFAVETSNVPIRADVVELRARDEAGRDISLDARLSGLTSTEIGGKS